MQQWELFKTLGTKLKISDSGVEMYCAQVVPFQKDKRKQDSCTQGVNLKW